MASFRWILQLHKYVPRAARFFSQGLDFNINVCSLRFNICCNLSTSCLFEMLHKLVCHYVGVDLIPQGWSRRGPNVLQEVQPFLVGLQVAAVKCMDGHMLGLYEPS
ncbi:hypothetical protein IFM89_021486 [Coptis chinensis]|uniref:Uncharacterized protein n=1 Tax=Coptis chinensis TaxID=261450 RepID=A0A835IRP3_9MAGN|nr:hypothetical protein IFM89_021486 [Coptis chinensis]